LLSSSRWFCRQVAAATREIFWQIYRDITRRTNSPIVDLPTFWYRFYPLIFGEEVKKQPIVALMPGFQERWAKVLSLPPGARRVALTTEELLPRVQEQFDTSDSGWKSAIYHSPDLMIAAESVDAIRRGEYQLVLGEMHASVNTLRPAFFSEHHPSRGDLSRFFQLDQIFPRAVPLIPKSLWPAKTARLLPVLITPQDFRIEFVPEPNSIPPSQVLPCGMLVVEDCGGELVVRTRDGRLRFDPLEVFSDTPTLSAINSFKVLASDRHTPRVTIDRLVVSRESWTFSPDEISCAFEKTDSGRFIEARRWAQSHGIPRFAFMKATSETKPVFVDFDSPVYVNIFSKIVRRARGTKEAQIAVSEMLPTPDQVWLPDAAGRHYTSELRVVAVDSPQKR
jgi:lantibiotic biosynthesis dehydratase-like protein